MSLYGSLFSGVTSLNAQSLALGDISENISNVNTIGFKASTTHFATLVSGGGDSASVGGVKHISKQNVAGQGILQQTTNALDLGIAGAGFFVVNDNVLGNDAFGQTQFTRAGHFELNNDKNLVNASGMGLMGWKLNSGGEFIDTNGNLFTPDPTSEADLAPVSLGDVAFSSQATENINIQASFPANTTVADTFETSIRVVDSLAAGHSLAMDFTVADHVELAGSLDDGSNGTAAFSLSNILTPAALAAGGQASTTAVNLAFAHNAGSTWDVTVTAANGTVDAGGTFSVEFDIEGNLIGDALRQVDITWDATLGAADSIVAIDLGNITLDDTVAPSLDGSTPEVNESGQVIKLDLSTTNSGDTFVSGDGTFLRFDQDGQLTSPSSLETTINWDNTESFASNSTIALNFGDVGSKNGLSVGGSGFELRGIDGDGIEFSPFESATVDADGTVFANFKNGTSLPVFRIPLADFNNANGLTATNGNAFLTTLDSGDFFLNSAGRGGVGLISPRSLEQSTVDIAREFSNMIITQRAFSSASTVITTADEMLQELVQLKR